MVAISLAAFGTVAHNRVTTEVRSSILAALIFSSIVTFEPVGVPGCIVLP